MNAPTSLKCRVYPTRDDGMGVLGFARYTLRLAAEPQTRRIDRVDPLAWTYPGSFWRKPYKSMVFAIFPEVLGVYAATGSCCTSFIAASTIGVALTRRLNVASVWPMRVVVRARVASSLSRL